jgi:hypothetical protein
VFTEAFEQPFEVVHGRDSYLEHRAGVAAKLVDLDDLGQLVGGGGLEQAAAGCAAHLDEGGQRQAGSSWVDASMVAGDHSRLFESSYPLGDGRWGQVHSAC